MNRRWQTVVVCCSFLYSPALIFAAPIDWQGPWTVALDQGQVVGAGAKQRAFGVSATLDGQTVDLDADLALARAEAVVLAPSSFAAGKVEFERSFRLAGAPQGWLVGLQGVLTGSLVIVTDPAMVAEVNVIGRAGVFDNNGVFAGPAVAVTKTRSAEGTTSFVLDVLRETALLDDGIYTIKGVFEANAVGGLVNGPLPPVIAQSRFFNGGWEVSLTARPAPAPPTSFLIGFGLLAMLAAARRRGGGRST